MFFDDLGPPWADKKHPCTDNQRTKVTPWATSEPRPKARKRGTATELVEAAQTIGLDESRYFYADGRSDHWTPIEIAAVAREGNLNSVTAVYLESSERELLNFSFHSEPSLLVVGDVVFKRNNEIAIFEISTSEELHFQIVLASIEK